MAKIVNKLLGHRLGLEQMPMRSDYPINERYIFIGCDCPLVMRVILVDFFNSVDYQAFVFVGLDFVYLHIRYQFNLPKKYMDYDKLLHP